ncbi:MAG: hypothetical protein HY392_00285 [Candidatus Diapherotrites archaeon]|nr:hypothetical protein [Candidatus Diapherotrites archaeon]
MFNPYKSEKYRLYMALPLVLFFVFFFIAFVYPGVSRGIDLRGGTLLRASLERQVNTASLQNELLEAFKLSDLQINTTTGPLGSKILIQFSSEKSLEKAGQLLEQARSSLASSPANAVSLSRDTVRELGPYFPGAFPENLSPGESVDFAESSFESAQKNFSDQLDSFLVEKLGLTGPAAISRNEVGASLGESFYSSAIFVAIVGIFLLSVVIFAFFRELVPSVAIIAGAIFDILGALALMAVFGIPLSLSTIPALLMLIGYAVDTEILMTTRLTTRKDETLPERAFSAMVTGLTMTMTALVALVSMLVISFYGQITVVFEIAAVLFFGLLADIISSWMLNTPLMLWYTEKNKKYS